MRHFLGFDTETTGLIDRNFELDHPAQPRIVQLAAMLFDEHGLVSEEMDVLIKPDGWTIPEELVATHGITTEKCEAEGIPMTQALERFNAMKAKCDARVGYNISFDKQMLAREAFAYKLPHDSEGKESICVMNLSSPLCKLPPTEKMMKAKRNTFKKPKLQEAYVHFFGREFEKAHSALADVKACVEIFFHIRREFPEEYQADCDKRAKKAAERLHRQATASAASSSSGGSTGDSAF